jgi:hypothetical protein
MKIGDEVLVRGRIVKVGTRGSELQVQFGNGERFKTSMGWVPASAVEAEACEAIEVLRAALRQTGCDGDLCTYEWHEKARRIIENFDETVRGERAS